MIARAFTEFTILRLKKPAVAVALLVAAFASLAAHPHVWIDGFVEVRVDDSRIAAVRAHWTFDPFFSEMIVLDFGPVSNGTFTDRQIEAIRRNAFDNLRHYSYFTSLEINGRKIPVEQVERFRASITEEGFLRYSFDIPINASLSGQSTTVRIAMYDESYFTDIVFERNYARVLTEGIAPRRYRKRLLSEQHIIPVWGPVTREVVEIVFEN